MPLKEKEKSKLFYITEDGVHELCEVQDISITPEEQCDIRPVKHFNECREGTFTCDCKANLGLDEFDLLCIFFLGGLKSNNWRKMHHIPMKSRKGRKKRKG